MAEYIDRYYAIKELYEYYDYNYPTASGDFDEYAAHEVPNILRNIPASDVQPIHRGEWAWNSESTFDNPYGSYECSECGNRADFKYNYCCSCGAKMKNAE